MTDDLVKRLRRNSGFRNEKWQCVSDPALLNEAAARIEALEAEVAKLRAERDGAYERAAEVAEDRYLETDWQEPGQHIAAAIRQLKGQHHE